jgi:hypothetical protein
VKPRVHAGRQWIVETNLGAVGATDGDRAQNRQLVDGEDLGTHHQEMESSRSLLELVLKNGLWDGHCGRSLLQ